MRGRSIIALTGVSGYWVDVGVVARHDAHLRSEARCGINANWITRFPPPADAPAVAADSLRTWRRWLERIAERFDEFLPLLGRAEVAGLADLAATWESAILALTNTAISWVIDDDYWPGSCRRVLEWFLTATGVPMEQAGTLVANAVGRRFDGWVPPRSADITDLAERLTRSMLDLSSTAPGAATGEWPGSGGSPRSVKAGQEFL